MEFAERPPEQRVLELLESVDTRVDSVRSTHR